MGKKVKIAAWAMNKNLNAGKTQEEMLKISLQRIDSVASCSPDLICLPELFMESAGDNRNPNWEKNSEEALNILKAKAKAINCYIIASVYEAIYEHPDKRYIDAVLIGRNGEIEGIYRKNHTVYEESTDFNAVPGTNCPVFNTDFGRIGMQICFDIGWRETWHQMAKDGARLVVWLSAYDGGYLLNAHAAHCMFNIVTAVQTDHAKIINFMGSTIAESSRWNGLAMGTLDLETEIFHTDRQIQKVDDIRKRLGNGVTIQTYSEENVFTIESNDSNWPMTRIIKEFGLITYKDYHAEAEGLQKEWHKKYGGK